jgi:hypothetical protein
MASTTTLKTTTNNKGEGCLAKKKTTQTNIEKSARNARALCMLTSHTTNINFSFQEKAMLVGWDVNMPNCVACRAKQRKARRGNKREGNQRVETKEVREPKLIGGKQI